MFAVILCLLSAVADLDYLGYRIGPEPAGVSVTFAAGEDSRGFTWFTDPGVGTGGVALVEGEAGPADAARFDAAELKQTATLTASQDHGRPVHSFQAKFYSLGSGRYSYRLGAPSHYRYGGFRVKDSPKAVTILNVNDAQTRIGPKLWMWERSCAAAARLLGRENIDFIIDGGDRFDGAFRDAGENTCPVHRHRYFQWAIATDAANRFLADVPLVWTAGNHDYYKLDSEKKPYAFIAEDWQWKDGYSYGGHSFDYGEVHIVTLPYCLAWKGVNEKSLAWLERDLAETARRGRAKWTILSMHAGPYSTGDNMRAAVCTNLVKGVGALCSKYHVDLVLQAHDHVFSKTLPYRWDAAGFTTDETDEAVINLAPRRTEVDGELHDTDPRGTYYVSAGCAGHRIGELDAFANRNGVFSYTNRLFKVATGRINVDSAYSKTGDDASKDVGRMMFGVIRINGDRLAYDWYTVGDDGIASLYDTLRVRKSTKLFPVRVSASADGIRPGKGLPERSVYFATHFGNWYDAATAKEIEEYIGELAGWGANGITAWFDMHDYRGLDDPAAQERIGRIRGIFGAARGRGLSRNLLFLANEGYASSPTGLRAECQSGRNGYRIRPGGFYHVEVCPSRPGGTEYLLGTREGVLGAFAEVGLDRVVLFPYDQGGCTCDDCAPWGANGYLTISEKLAALARHLFPGIGVDLSTWRFDAFGDLHEWDGLYAKEAAVAKWADRLYVEPGHLGKLDARPLLPYFSMLEISMGGMLPWGGFGANPRPSMIEKLIGDHPKAAGMCPYSEGIYEDMNKVIALAMLSGRATTADAAVGLYAGRYFGRGTEAAVVEAARLLEANLGHNALITQDGKRYSSYSFDGLDRARPFKLVVETRNLDRERADLALSLLKNAETHMKPEARASWRWRILRLRAEIDARLAAGCEPETLSPLFDELADIYHVRKDAVGYLVPPSISLLRSTAASNIE